MGNEAEKIEPSSAESGASAAAASSAHATSADSTPLPVRPVGIGDKYRAILNTARSMLTDLRGFWAEQRVVPVSVSDFYANYLVPLAVLAGVCTFISELILFKGFFSILLGSIIQVGLVLGLAYVSAIIIEKLAPPFKASATRSNALRLLGYSITPAAIAGSAAVLVSPIFHALAVALLAVSAIGALYGLFAMYVGFSEMLSVPPERKAGFFAGSIAAIIVATLVIVPIVDLITPKLRII